MIQGRVEARDKQSSSPQRSSVKLEEDPKQTVVVDTLPTSAATVSTPTEAQTVKTRKFFRWRWWKKTKPTPPTEDVAENTNFATSAAEESVCIKICDGGDVGVQEAPSTPDRPVSQPSETLVTEDVPVDTSLSSSDTDDSDFCVLFGGGDAGVEEVTPPTDSSVSSLESLELNGADNAGDNLPTDPPVSNKLVQAVHSGSQQGEDSKKRKLSKVELACLGLPNLDETCYMNSVLQALLTLTPFVEEVHNQQEVWKSHHQSKLFRSFKKVEDCRLSKNERQKKIALVKFKEIVACSNPEFADDEQKDAHEFLSCALNMLSFLYSDLYAEAKKKDLMYTCPVSAHIGFKMLGTRTCKGCGVKSTKQEDFINLSLNLVPEATVSQCLQEYLRESDLDYQCDCGAKESTEICSFSTLPDVLIIQLMRFKYGLKRTFIKLFSHMGIMKVSSRVILSTELVVVPESGITEQAKYSLVSVVSHLGRSSNYGHYICDGVHRPQNESDGTDRWLTFNDEDVNETTAKSVCLKREKTAYLLFYEKQQ